MARVVAGALRDGTARRRAVFAGARGRLTAGLLLLEMLVAVQILVVATIMPAVRRDLGDLQLYGWTFSATGLGQFAAIPIAGRAFDRFGAPRVLAVTLFVFSAGLVFAAAAPSMLALIFARLLQGIGGGAMYAVSLSTVAKTYPSDIRARVLALLAAMWILPGVVGPPLGAGAVLAGLTSVSSFTIPLVVLGVGVAVPALLRIVPSGTLRARRGVAAAAAAAFLLSVGFEAGEAFVPLMLTAVRGRAIAEAGLLLTLMTVAWAGGSWGQSRVAVRISPRKLVAIGGSALATGLLSLLLALVDVPLVVPYLGWTIAGVGMGIAWPTVPLSVMDASSRGRQA